MIAMATNFLLWQCHFSKAAMVLAAEAHNFIGDCFCLVLTTVGGFFGKEKIQLTLILMVTASSP